MNREISAGRTEEPSQAELRPSDGFVPFIGMDASVARGLAPPYFRDVRYRGVEMALYTIPFHPRATGSCGLGAR